jgi:hypothetical protein
MSKAEIELTASVFEQLGKFEEQSTNKIHIIMASDSIMF